MKLNPEFFYDEETHTTYCHLTYRGMPFSGVALCHPDDLDYCSERTGSCIAEARAYIGLLRFKRDFEIKPQLVAVKHLYTNMKSSKNFNPKSYEAKMVRSQLRAIENQLATANNEIIEEQKYLREYINNKDALYKKLRAKSKQ